MTPSWLCASALALVACSRPTSINSQLHAPVGAPITALDVQSQVGAKNELSAPAFRDELGRLARACGLQLTIAGPATPAAGNAAASPTPSTPPAAPRYVLSLTEDSDEKDRFRKYRSLRYLAHLVEANAKRAVWDASLMISIRYEAGDEPAGAVALARDLLSRLRDDRLIAPCAALDAP